MFGSNFMKSAINFIFSGLGPHIFIFNRNDMVDIIISFNYMNKPKNLDNYEFKVKTIKIFIHGFLHLLGHDHQKSVEYKQMLNEEKKIFKSIEKTSILN